jgi:hypothetical protein
VKAKKKIHHNTLGLSLFHVHWLRTVMITQRRQMRSPPFQYSFNHLMGPRATSVGSSFKFCRSVPLTPLQWKSRGCMDGELQCLVMCHDRPKV